MKLVEAIIPYNMTHNAESEACDLAMETDRIDLLEAHVDEKAYARVRPTSVFRGCWPFLTCVVQVCLYLQSCVPFVAEPTDTVLKQCCLSIFRKFDQWPQAMQMALKLNDLEIITEVFLGAKDKFVRRQLAFMLARQQVVLDLDTLLEDQEQCVDTVCWREHQPTLMMCARGLGLKRLKC